MTPNTNSPGFPAVEAGAKSPQLPPRDRIIKVTAYRRADGWITVTVYYEACEDRDWDACVERARYYIPAQRAPVKMSQRWRQWTSKRYIELWLKAVEEYIADVGRVIEFAAAHADGEAAKALREYNIVIKAAPSIRQDNGATVINMGLVAGGKVVELGPPPDLEYVAVTHYIQELKWERPISPPQEYFQAIAYTYRWWEAVERVAGCKAAGMADGSIRVECGSDEITIDNMVPLGQENTTVRQLMSLADALHNDLPRREATLQKGLVEIIDFRIRKIKPARGP